jgi:hypothetical protein
MRFDPEDLGRKLAALPPYHRVAFAAACCERLLPNYAVFSRSDSWGDTGILRTALDEAWRAVERQEVDEPKLRSLLSECERIIPDTEDFDTPLVSAALDAGSAVLETLRLCLDGDQQRAVDVASFARDTVDMFIQERDDMDYDDPRFEERIAEDPLMLRELGKQQADLELLQHRPKLTPSLLKRLREGSGGSNIDLT